MYYQFLPSGVRDDLRLFMYVEDIESKCDEHLC